MRKNNCNLIAAVYTPMSQDCSLNTSIVNQYAYYLNKNKISGVFINGSTGDFVSLTTQERKDITLAWSSCKTKDLYLIDHVGDPSLEVAKDLAKHASDKADAIAVLAPFYFRIDSLDKLIYYCKEVSASAPNIPFYYYHIPSLSGAKIDILSFLKRASKEIPQFAGIKFTDNQLIDFLHCKNYSLEEYNILFGYDELFLPSLSLGANSWVGSTYNHLAPIYFKIKEYFDHGQMEKAANLQTKAIRFVEILNAKGGFNGVGKYFMKYLGVDCGPSRFPHINLEKKSELEIVNSLKALGVIEYLNHLPIN